MASAREKAEAARYKPAKKKTVKKAKKKVDTRSAREKAEAARYKPAKKKTAVSKSVRPKARTLTVSKTTLSLTPAEINKKIEKILKNMDSIKATQARAALKAKREARQGKSKTGDRFSGLGGDLKLIEKMIKGK
jgi:hypothetical protein